MTNNHDSACCASNSVADLPSGILEYTASFLAASSRALFASALNTSRPIKRTSNTSLSASIVGKDIIFLDFGDIEAELAAKLSDEDISSVLLCIDAVNKLKRLRLTNCINVTGVCLEPLRGSTVIENIDLTLVGDHVTPILYPKPRISQDVVLPILDSIIEGGDNSRLKLLQFPWKWRENRTPYDDAAIMDQAAMISFGTFINRYRDFLESRAVNCLKCNCNLPPADGDWYDGLINMLRSCEPGPNGYATHQYTCHKCLEHYCHACKEDDGACLPHCSYCERRHCFHCEKMTQCLSCCAYFCVNCCDLKACSQCDEIVCPWCLTHRHCKPCDGEICCIRCYEERSCKYFYCDDCGLVNCVDCHPLYWDTSGIQHCPCGVLCGKCRVNRYKKATACMGCFDWISYEDGKNIEEVNRMKRKIQDISGLELGSYIPIHIRRENCYGPTGYGLERCFVGLRKDYVACEVDEGN